MMREGIPKGRSSMSKTTEGKSNVGNVDMRFEEEIEGGSIMLVMIAVCVVSVLCFCLMKLQV